jgi:replicative DNA helicase
MLIDKILEIISDENFTQAARLERIRRMLNDDSALAGSDIQPKGLKDLWIEGEISEDNPFNSQAILSGFGDLDRLTGGFLPGELVIVGGRPSMGKTQLLVNMALTIAKTYPVLYFTYDLSKYMLCSRMVSALTKVPINKMFTGTLTADEEGRIKKLQHTLDVYKLFIEGEGINQLEAVRNQIVQFVKQENIKVVVLDYIQLLSANLRKANRYMEIGHISRELKILAQKHKLVIIVASQLNRSVESRYGNKQPQLIDLSESGALEQDADKVIFIYRPEYYGFDVDEFGGRTDRVIELIVAKNRLGTHGTAKLIRDDGFTFFTDFEERTKQFRINPKSNNELNDPF